MTQPPAFRDLVVTFARIGVMSFGGAAGQIALMHRVVVEEKRWLDEARFVHALNYCMMLPGPEAHQLATYIGWLTHGVRGGLAAGLLFVAPGAAVMLALSWLYVLGAGLAWLDGAFLGVKAAVAAIVAQAVIRIARRGLRDRRMLWLAAAAFAAITLLAAPFPLIVLAAGLIGAALARGDAAQSEPPPVRAHGTLRTTLLCLAAWGAPVALAALMLGPGHVLVEIGLFFSQLAVLTFGGAYAVLGWLAQAGVARGWVTAAEMIDGLGLADTTPGPTILVNQFIAFLAASRDAGGMAPMLAATLGALMATWTTFAPSFLWIFAGAPFADGLRRAPRLAGALAGVTAAVVRVIAHVALWFGLHVLFADVGAAHWGPLRLFTVAPESLDARAAALTALALALSFGLGWGVTRVVGVLAALGVALELA